MDKHKETTVPSIRKLPSGRFNCQVRRKHLGSISRSFDTLHEAELWAAQQEAFGPASTSRTSTQTFRDIAYAYLARVLQGRPSQNEQRMRVERMSPHFPQPFASISKWDVNTYKTKRLSEVSGTTCRDELVLLNRLFKWAKRELLLELDNPCVDIALPPTSKPRSKVVTSEELTALLGKMTPVMREVVELAYETAMRRSEILKLTPSCLHLGERYLDVIDGKTGSRSVPLTTRAVELLRIAQERQDGRNARLYPLAAHSVSQALRRARRELGYSEDIRFHQLRHTRISVVARKGFNQAQIMMVSGHRDSRSVQRYTHLNVQDVIGLLD